MAKRGDPARGPYWHYDCRIEAELPEDRVVGIRFLTTAAFSLAAAVTFLTATWLVYRDITLRYQIKDWYQRIEDSREGMKDVDRMESEYAAESTRIEAAYDVMKHPYVVSEFLATFGKMLPAELQISDIDSSDSGIIVKGTIHESTEVASKTLGTFVKTLNATAAMNKLFSPIRLTSLVRREEDDVITFRITFLPKS